MASADTLPTEAVTDADLTAASKARELRQQQAEALRRLRPRAGTRDEQIQEDHLKQAHYHHYRHQRQGAEGADEEPPPAKRARSAAGSPPPGWGDDFEDPLLASLPVDVELVSSEGDSEEEREAGSQGGVDAPLRLPCMTHVPSVESLGPGSALASPRKESEGGREAGGARADRSPPPAANASVPAPAPATTATRDDEASQLSSRLGTLKRDRSPSCSAGEQGGGADLRSLSN